MRSQILSLLAGAIGLAAIVASAPALSSNNADVCDPISTVFVTVSQPVTVTVAVHDSPINTGLSSPAGALSTTTITRYSTVRSTTTAADVDTNSLTRSESTGGVQAAVLTPISYDTTIYKTVTIHQTGPSPSSSSLLAFIVENGTTFWLGGNTPAPSKSYVIATSVVTIQPVNTAVGTTYLTSTLTLHITRYTTIYTTRPQPVTRTLSSFNGTFTQTSRASVSSSFGTVPNPVRTSTSWAGWNTTSTTGGAVFPGTSGPAKASKSEASFITQETVDIYKTTSSSYTISTYTAKGGFNAITTPSTFSANPSASSDAEGAWTTAVIDGQSVSWNAHGVTQTYTDSSTRAPRTNTTSAVTTSSSSSSKWYIYSPATLTETSVTATGSALGGVALASSSSNSSIAHLSISTATVIPVPATTSLSYSQIADVSSASSEITDLLSSSTTTIASSHMGVFPTTSSSSFLTSISSSVVDSSASRTASNTTISTMSSSASSTPTNCGVVGDFILDFDDIPPLSISNDSTFGQQQPIFSPYHHFDFSRGFTVGPPPIDPYLPESKPLLVEFTPSANAVNNVKQTRPDADAFTSGYISNVDHGLTNCFSFNLYGASFGCDSLGPDCDFTFTGYRYDAIGQSSRPVVTQQLALSACPALKSLDCVLTPITLNSAFEELDSVRINVTVQGVPKIWWMDDLRLGWSDNTCEKGMCRAKAPARGFVLPMKI